MIRRPPRSTRTDPLFPSPPPFRSAGGFLPKRLLATAGLILVALAMGPTVAAAATTKLDLPIVFLTRAEEPRPPLRSEEHTSELQSLMRISYAVFCLKKKNKNQHMQNRKQHTCETLQLELGRD